jgi:HEAT repeat protein
VTLLALAASWLLAGVPCAGQELDALARQLGTGDERARRKAVQELGKLASSAAFELLIGALDDASPMVADEVQLVLPRLLDPERLELLLGKQGLAARDELVRLRSAELLGVASLAVPGASCAKALGDDDARVRRALCTSVERLARAGQLGEPRGDLAQRLARAAERDKDPDARAAAWLAELALSDAPASLDTLRAALGHELFTLRAAAVVAAAELAPEEHLALARAALADEHAGVRTLAVEALSQLAETSGPPAALALVEALEAERTLRVSWTLDDALQRLSGLAHRLDPRPWRAWATGLAPDWRPGAPAERTAPERDRASAALAGLPILSERVVFLIDFSGSMWQRREGDKTRKQAVDLELRRALEALPESARFNVIPYTDRPLPWQPALVPASERDVARALADFESCRAQGKGNFWDAALLALRDPDVDTIVLLSDGAPTGGQRWNVGLMRALFAVENRFRRVALQAVLVDCPKGLQQQWAEICAESHGAWLAAEL